MSIRLRKAIIPAAGRGTRHFPASSAVRKEFFPLVDRDGVTRPVIHLIAEEALSAGIEEICVVTAPDEAEEFRRYFRDLTDSEKLLYANREDILSEAAARAQIGQRLRFAEQREQHGYGHAIACARSFAGGEPVLILLGDHIYISDDSRTCARQLMDQWEQCGGSISSVHPVPESLIHRLGVLRLSSSEGPPWPVAEIVEKPDVTTARKRLITFEGDRPYLAYFGTHIMQPEIFDRLDHNIRNDIRTRGEIQLTDAQAALAAQGNYWAGIVQGRTFDIGVPEGYAITQSVLAKAGPFAEAVSRACIGV